MSHRNRKENNTDHRGRLLGRGEESGMQSRKWVHTHLIQYTELVKILRKADRAINFTSCCAGFTVEAGTDGVDVGCLG